MAEVLGAIAGGINIAQFAGQIAKSVIILKEYWDLVNDAPADIHFLLREIESLCLILERIEYNDNLAASSARVGEDLCYQQCVALCQEGN